MTNQSTQVGLWVLHIFITHCWKLLSISLILIGLRNFIAHTYCFAQGGGLPPRHPASDRGIMGTLWYRFLFPFAHFVHLAFTIALPIWVGLICWG